ncbi:CLUMA_CG008927, isoform A [Clunio marinus]|uniref:CLUMA_CG008927, isoform A n=1 Tax=Clunio marinus TaxID=568069 RepID=A0A1J1I6T9_9DIPT|nr:CLUMA_CG008927, isoform A [Clunio marinus]
MKKSNDKDKLILLFLLAKNDFQSSLSLSNDLFNKGLRFKLLHIRYPQSYEDILSVVDWI